MALEMNAAFIDNQTNHVKNLFQQHYDIFLFTIQER
jgi:hypothetical protein